MYEQYYLKNKANIILVPQKDVESVTVLIMYPVGSRYESEKMSGVSHYVEHLMFKGTKKRKNTQILTREIDRLGAAYNAFTGKEYTGYYIKTAAKYCELTLDILSDMLFNSTFDPKEMEREKGPIVEELRMYKDNPMMNIDNIFEDLLYEGCPLGRDIGGTEKHVLGFKRPDVLAYKDKYYGPNNMTIVVAGKVDENTKKLIEKYFANEKNKNNSSLAYKPFCFGDGSKSKRFVVQDKKTDQVQLMLGFPGFAYGHKDSAVVTVMNTILGGSMSSRLFIQIRERRGLAYMVRSGDEQYRDTGYIYVRAGLEAKNINRALKVIENEIDKMKNKKVTKSELADAKSHIKGSHTLTMEDSSAQASWYAQQALFAKKIETPEQKYKRIEKVTGEQVQAVAKKLYKMSTIRMAIIGDVKKSSINF